MNFRQKYTIFRIPTSARLILHDTETSGTVNKA